MFVKKFKVNRNELTDESTLDVPLDMTHQEVDNSDVIEREFVEEETEKKINPIVDYEKFRFKPYYEDSDGNLNEIKVVTYNLHFYIGGSHDSNTTTYDDIGITNDDLKFRKNRFTNSFLRLLFYNTDITTDQNLITFSDLFCNLRNPSNDPDLNVTDIDTSKNLPKLNSDIPVKFQLTNPSLTSSRIHEGVHIFWYKTDLPQELYMQATFNNAANGSRIDFMNESGSPSITNLIDKLHVKFTLNKNGDDYYYVVDRNYSNNVSIDSLPNTNNKQLTIDLYELNVS